MRRSVRRVASQVEVAEGDLVPDELVIGLIEEKLQNTDSEGFIFDGFPRTLAQADALEALLDQVPRHALARIARIRGESEEAERCTERFETIRAYGSLRMGLINEVGEAAARQHTPKVAFVAPPSTYTASSGKQVAAQDIDLQVRALSMGKLHHAMMGTGAVAIATAAAIPGTLVNLAAGGGERNSVVFGHPSGTLKVGAEAALCAGEWTVARVSMSRSARVLM